MTSIKIIIVKITTRWHSFFFYFHSFLASNFCCNDISQKPNILQHPTEKSESFFFLLFLGIIVFWILSAITMKKKGFDCKVITYVMVALKMTWKIAFVRVLHKDIAFSIYFKIILVVYNWILAWSEWFK